MIISMDPVDQAIDDLIWAVNSPSLISDVFLDSESGGDLQGKGKIVEFRPIGVSDISREHLQQEGGAGCGKWR